MSTRGPMPRYADGSPKGEPWPVWRVARQYAKRDGRWDFYWVSWEPAGESTDRDRHSLTHAEALAYALEQANVDAGKRAEQALDAILRAPQPQPAQLPATYAERAAQGWEYTPTDDGHWAWREANA